MSNHNSQSNIQTCKELEKESKVKETMKTDRSQIENTSKELNQEVLYISGKQFDNKNRVLYFCHMQNDTQEWIQSQNLGKFSSLIYKYEEYHSRFNFYEIYKNQQFQEEIKQKQGLQLQQPKQKTHKNAIQHQGIENTRQLMHPRERKLNQGLEDISGCKEESSEDVYITGVTKKIQKTYKPPMSRVNLHTSDQSSDDEAQQQQQKHFNNKVNPQKTKMNYFIKNQKCKEYGSFNKEKPQFISKHKMDESLYEKLKEDPNGINNQYKLYCYFYKVEWKPSESSGKRKKGHYYTYKELKRVAPKLLLDYFEKMAQLLR